MNKLFNALVSAKSSVIMGSIFMLGLYAALIALIIWIFKLIINLLGGM